MADIKMINPFNPFGPIQPENFAGRQKEIDEFNHRLKSTKAGTVQNMAVMGERGIGKTSLLRKLEEIALDESCIAVRIDLHPAIDTLDRLLYNIYEEIRKVALHYYGPLGRTYKNIQRFLENYTLSSPYGGIQRTGREQPIEAIFTDRMLDMWSNISKKVSAVVIMVDEAEQLAKIKGSLEFLRNSFSRLGEKKACYSLVISGKLGLFRNLSEVFSPLERFFSPVTLEPFTNIEVEEAIKVALGKGKGRGSDKSFSVQFTSDVIERIAEKSEGQPYVVQLFGYWLYEHAVEGGGSGQKVVDLKAFDIAKERVYSALKMQLFERRLAEGSGRSKYKAEIMRKLSRAQERDGNRGESFSFSEIEKITGVKKEQGLGVYLNELVESGCLRRNESTGRYSFFMKIFKEYVREYT
jgi:type II secretory pathway predicted ATPase ExeA